MCDLMNQQSTLLRITMVYEVDNQFLLGVEVLEGEPLPGMLFTSPEIQGQWIYNCFPHYIPDLTPTVYPRMPIGVSKFTEDCEPLQPHIHLIEIDQVKEFQQQ